MARSAPRESLTILDYSDREFLLVVVDCYDADGWATSEEIRKRMNLSHRRTSSSRLSWLRRFGAVEREEERDQYGNLRGRANLQRWRLTEIGEAIAYGKLKAGQENALADASDGQVLLLTRALIARTRHADGTAVKLAQREWRHQWAQRNGRRR